MPNDCHPSYSALTDTTYSFWHFHLVTSKAKRALKKLIHVQDGRILSPTGSEWSHAHPDPTARGTVEDTPARRQLPLLSWLRKSETPLANCSANLLGERGEVHRAPTCNTWLPDSGEGDLPWKSLTSTGSATKVQSRMISAVIANLSLSARQPHLTYYA